MEIRQILDGTEKRNTVRLILEALPEWFGIPEARENYINESSGQICFCASDTQETVGFLCLKETGRDTVELAVMGVLKEHHRKGIGRNLFEHARKHALKKGYSFIQAKTVQMGKYDDYDKTNLFYISLGFKEFEVFPTLWDEANPCQIYVMSLHD